MKRIQALVAAILMTALVGLCMLAIGVNAALNTNTVPVSDAPPSASAASPVNSTGQTQDANSLIAQYQDREKQYQAQIQQLNNLVTQYQSREQQYQSQLNQANTTVQQLQNILTQLQRMGILRINSDGSIQVRRGGD